MSTLISVENLSAYFHGRQVLDDVTLSIQRREIVAVVGDGKSGKSTLLRCLIGAHVEAEGFIEVDGSAPKIWNTREAFLHGVAYVPQGQQLFLSLTVEENLRIAKRQFSTHAFWTLASVYDLLPSLREHRYRSARELTPMQSQMVVLGRALMNNPRVLLVDSLGYGVIAEHAAELYGTFDEIRAQKTAILMTESNIELAVRMADRVVCLREGRINYSSGEEAGPLVGTSADPPAGLLEGLRAAYLAPR